MKRILLILLAATFVYSANAEWLHLSKIGQHEGLSCEEVKDMVFDHDNRLWIATEDGLNCFNGSFIIPYYQDKLSGSELNCLLDAHEEGKLYIGTQRDGLNTYDYKTAQFKHYRKNRKDPSALATNDVTSLAKAADGGVWIGTYWKGVDYKKFGSDKFIHYNQSNVKGLVSNHTWKVMDLGNGKLLVGHVNDGISIIDIKRRTARNYRHSDNDPSSIKANEVLSVLREDKYHIWVGTNIGLDLFDLRTGKFTHFTDGDHLHRRIFDIKKMKNGDIWIGTELGGIVIMHRHGGNTPDKATYSYITESDDEWGLNNKTVRSILYDKYDNIWIGTWGGGVNFLTPNDMLFVNMSYMSGPFTKSVTHHSLSSVCFGNDGRIFVGSMGGGLDVLGADWSNIGSNYPTTGASQNIHVVYSDTKGDIWIGCFGGGAYVSRDGINFKQIFTADIANPSEIDARGFYDDGKGNLYVATSNHVYCFDRATAKLKKHIIVPENITSVIATDRSGNLLVGTFSSGLFIFDRNYKLLSRLETENGLPSNTINYIMTHSDGSIWLATGKGLAVLYGNAYNKIKVYGFESGLKNLHVKAVLEDDKHNIWVSTNQSISVMVHGMDKFINYTYKDGISTGNFSEGGAGQTKDKKLIAFTSYDGVTMFAPSRVLLKNPSPRVLISAVQVYKSVVGVNVDSIISTHASAEIELSYDENIFTVNFSVDDYSKRDLVEYRYRLLGQNSNWTVTDRNRIEFRDIAPGDYTLEICCRFRNQQWGKPSMLNIAINPPLWLTWWAKTIYIILLVLLVFYSNRSFARRKLDKERLGLFTDMYRKLSENKATNKSKDESKGIKRRLTPADIEFIKHVDAILEKNINRNFGVSQLAQELGMNEATVYRKMKRCKGMTTFEYIRYYKMERVKKLLTESDYNISQIASMLGMRDSAYLRRCFKETFGINPGEFKEEEKE